MTFMMISEVFEITDKRATEIFSFVTSMKTIRTEYFIDAKYIADIGAAFITQLAMTDQQRAISFSRNSTHGENVSGTDPTAHRS
jgi:hypothetical protein